MNILIHIVSWDGITPSFQGFLYDADDVQNPSATHPAMRYRYVDVAPSASTRELAEQRAADWARKRCFPNERD